VTEFFGSVSVEAQVENVQHFEVRTAVLAAVVIGTKFTVVANKTRASISVQRGHVAVTDAKGKIGCPISVGQSATVDRLKGWALTVAGIGKLPQILTTYGPTHPEVLGTVTGQQTDASDGGPAESSGAGASGTAQAILAKGRATADPTESTHPRDDRRSVGRECHDCMSHVVAVHVPDPNLDRACRGLACELLRYHKCSLTGLVLTRVTQMGYGGRASSL
jgi:hypothetical protein